LDIIWLSISSGVGPEECRHVAGLTLKAIQKEIEENENNIKMRLINVEPSYVSGNIRSALIAIEGEKAREFTDSWVGTIKWIWSSTYRPHHKRKNWFIKVTALGEPEKTESFLPSDVRFETARSSGPGGQYVNKTETAVRAIHIPTGKSVLSREERSQLLNKKLALARLATLFNEEQTNKKKKTEKKLRHSHWELERGNPIRMYDGETLRLIKKVSHLNKTN
jgi:peptide chain release factor